MSKPHLRVIAGRPVVIEQRETKLEAAKRRYGDRPFGHEPGTAFRWAPNPTVLTDWLSKRTWEKSTATPSKEKA